VNDGRNGPGATGGAPREASPEHPAGPEAGRGHSPATEPPLPVVTTQQLAYLVEAARAPTWAQAAASLGVTSSALSQGIAELERRLGIPLFDWSGRRRVFRADAATVLAYAERALAQARDLARWLDEARTGRAGRLRLGMIDAVAVAHYPDVLRRFRDARPGLDLHLVVAPSAALLAQLAAGELDLAVCVEPHGHAPELEAARLLAEPLALYGPEGAEAVPPAGWGPWVTYPEGSHTRALTETAVRSLGAGFDVVAESHQPEVLREMVRLGLGWAVLPVGQAESGPGRLRRARPEPVAVRHLAAVRRRDRPPTPAADALVAALVARSPSFAGRIGATGPAEPPGGSRGPG
jgi:DNA-binding transcriptional LysR family regulator